MSLQHMQFLIFHSKLWLTDPFYSYLVPLTIGPAFFSAAIYLCLGRVITIYGAEISRFKPKTYTYIFVSCDLISLILQAAGGAIASSASDTDTSGKDLGVNIMIAGLSFQVASLFLFSVMASEFFWRLSKSNPAKLENDNYAYLREDWKLTAFVYGMLYHSIFLDILILTFFPLAMAGAVLTIFIRSVFRVAELQGGFQSKLANDEVDLMILESAMISIAVILMTVAHPSICIGRVWRELK